MKLWRLLGLLALLAAAISVGIISTQRVSEQSAVLEACGAVETGDWNTALRLTDGLALNGAAGRNMSECRCIALLGSGQGERCEALMERLLADPAADKWVPQPRLAVHLIQTRRTQGRSREAMDLATRAARAYPDDPDLFYLELSTRIGFEDEEQVLRELESRIDPNGPHVTRMRISLATRQLIRGDTTSALEVLGNGPPSGTRNAVERWYDTRGMAQANAGDLAALRRTYAQWAAAGGESNELSARYALTISISGLRDPEHSTLDLLRSAIERADGVASDALVEAVITRMILTLVVSGRQQDALNAYDIYSQRFELAGLVREELERSRAHERLAAGGAATGSARFEIPGAPTGARLWLSPGPQAAPDTDYEDVPLAADGTLEVAMEIGPAPLRWVYRSDGATLASGSVELSAGNPVEVVVQPRAPEPDEAAHTAQRRAGDGNKRVFLLILDCADWRILQYLRTRGDLPTLDALARRGFRAVLDSDPPLTAAALEALVRPDRSESTSLVGIVHQMGVELAGLASVGENPFDALAWILPDAADLFAAVGAGPHTAANLLFSHGGIEAGRHSEVTGPQGQRRRLPLASSARDLNRAERARWPGLAEARHERDAVHLRTIAAEFDTAEQIAREREIDFLALRIEGLDILTHSFFGRTVRDGQDDGERFLYEVYRYIDARIGHLLQQLDADDVLITMSDHGIRTSMEHSRDAIFMVDGAGIPNGRAEGRPALRGVSAVVAELMGVKTGWPRTGVAPWAGTSTAHTAGAGAR